jgi:hypothetical protein
MNDATLTDYCNTFLGFGGWKTPIWFIGIEEAGGKNLADVENRLRAWGEHGRKSLEDAPRFYPASGNTIWHGANAKIQRTWRQLIRILLLAQGKADTESTILDYQRNQLGRRNGDTCLMELFPLPSPNIGIWNYNQWSTLAWLQSRNSYINEIRARRENELRRQINRHNPKAVIFYGCDRSLLPSWSSIAGGDFKQAIPDEMILLWRANVNTVFFVTRHPAAESDQYFQRIGRFLRANYGNRFQNN